MKRNRLGIILIIVGLAGAAILALLGGMSESQSVASFGRANVGCRTMFQFDKPGTYYIYVETGGLRVIDQGCPPSASSDELVLSLYADSSPVPLVPDASVGYRYDGASAVSTSRFELEASGRFELIAVGPDVNQVVALGANPAIARRPWWFAAGMVLAIGTLGGMVLVLWARSKRPKASAGATRSGDRPGLPATVRSAERPTVSPRPSLPKGANTAQIPTVKPQPAASSKPIPPIVPVSDTPTGQSRPRTEPVVSSGSTAGASDRGANSGRRGRRRAADDWDLVDDGWDDETVGGAFDDDDEIRPRGPRQRRSTPEYDEYDDDFFDDDEAADGPDWDDGYRPRRSPRSRTRREYEVIDDVGDDGYGARPARSRRRIPARYDFEPDDVGGPIDDYADDDEFIDFDSGADDDHEYVDAYLDDGYGDDGYGDDGYGDDGDYRGDPYMEPPEPRAPRRNRRPQSGRPGQRPRRREPQPTPARRPRRGAATGRSKSVPDPDDERFNAGRSLPEQRRTQPRRRRTPTPPPPPGDEWEELPPPPKSPAAPSATDGAVVSDEWATDGDDTGAWRWWSPPDPSERAQR